MSPLKINGWTIYAHPLFLEQVATLTGKVERLREKDPLGFRSKPATKRLSAIVKLAKNDIPQDPAGPQYRQGNTLGAEHTHWCRAKFYQQYRLFFRYDLSSKVLIYAWVNDESTRRADDNKQDAYAVFRKMLKSGKPPDSWNDLWSAAMSDGEHTRALLGSEGKEP